MKTFLSLIILACAIPACAQFSLLVDTNGVLTGTRSTNFYRTNFTRAEAAYRGRTFNNQTHTNAFIHHSYGNENSESNWTSIGTLYIDPDPATTNAGVLFNLTFFVYMDHLGNFIIENSDSGQELIRFTPGGNTVLTAPVVVSNNVTSYGSISAPTGELAQVVFRGSNYIRGRFASLAGTYTTLVNGNNAALPTGTNSVLELSGGTTIAQISGFAATGEGDEFEARFSGAVTNWIVNEVNSAFATDATAGNRIKTGTAGDITLTNQPSWAKFRYRSSRWELQTWSR